MHVESETLEKIVNVELYDNQTGEIYKVSTEYLKSKWENDLKNEGIDVTLEKFEVITSDENDETTYFLKAISADGSIETGAFIEKSSYEANTPSGSYILKRKTCTCQGCPSGCNLTTLGTNCYCSSCPSWEPQNCVKTENEVIEPDL